MCFILQFSKSCSRQRVSFEHSVEVVEISMPRTRRRDFASLEEVHAAFECSDPDSETPAAKRRRLEALRYAVCRFEAQQQQHITNEDTEDVSAAVVVDDDVDHRQAMNVQYVSQHRLLMTASARAEVRLRVATRLATTRSELSEDARLLIRTQDATQHATRRNHERYEERETRRLRDASQHRVAHMRTSSYVSYNALASIDDFQESMIDNRHKLPSMTSQCQYCHALKWPDETPKGCCLGGKVVLQPQTQVSSAWKALFENGAFLKKLRMYNSIFAFTSLGASIDERLANGREGVYTFRV